MSNEDPKRIAVTMSLYPEEYGYIDPGNRCKKGCDHLWMVHDWDGCAQQFVCNLPGCECTYK